MNVLQIGSYLHPDLVGGAEVTAYNLRQQLEQHGSKVVSLSRKSSSLSLNTRFEKDDASRFVARNWRPYEPIDLAPSRISKALFYGLEALSPVDNKALGSVCASQAIDLILVHSIRGI